MKKVVGLLTAGAVAIAAIIMILNASDEKKLSQDQEKVERGARGVS
ncbi:hypothetical protein [Chitinivibrio alkaliphilus]|uniref:Uncharacterized protein n=1 Tax=Chitinivibrio alkaliphilus ACht1 TaxID=1313304 RepID=U7DAN3_9BACT|nr:hypothetical protein [Chitinivibrio alkaliphilus]ERP31455.1 hypothetical protein CALK_1658 [Chitinivibrio alkaliphilus ACht1]